LSLLEARLRPPVEVWSAATSLSAAAIVFTAPSWFLMTEGVAYTAAGLLSALGVRRLNQAYKVVKYRRGLKRVPHYEIDLKDAPQQGNYLFVGKGFRWGQEHSQRLKDASSPKLRHYIEDGKWYTWARNHERKFPNSALTRLTSINSIFNPVRPRPPVGGNSVLHGCGIEKEQDIFLTADSRVGNTLVMGTTRQGKSVMLALLATQDILRGDGVVIVFEPKGDCEVLTACYEAAKAAGREDDFIAFNLGFPEMSARYNSVGNFDVISSVSTRITNQLSSEGNSAVFQAFSWRFLNIVARVLVMLGERPNYDNMLRSVTDIEPLFRRFAEYWLPRNAPEDWQSDVNAFEEEYAVEYKKNRKWAKYQSPRTDALRHYVEGMESTDGVMHGLLGALRYDKTFYEKLVASLIPLLEKLTTGKLGALLAPDYFDLDDERPVFDFMSAIRKKAIVVIQLDGLTDFEIAKVVGNSMFSDLVSVAGHIYKHGTENGMLDGEEGKMPKIYVHADELNSLIGDEYGPLVNRGAGAGIVQTAYTQARADMEVPFGSEAAKARQIEGNFNNLLMFRCRDKYTAELMTDQLPEVELSTVMQVSGATDSSNVDNEADFTSNTQDRISVAAAPMLEPSSIMSLPKGQLFGLINGGELFKIRVPLRKPSNVAIPATLREMVDKMRATYTTSDRWWDQ